MTGAVDASTADAVVIEYRPFVSGQGSGAGWPVGIEDPLEQARRFSAAGAGTVVITRGAQGSVHFDGREMWTAAAFPVERMVDGTGGGDAFAGVPGAPAVDFTLPTAEIGTGSFLGSVAFDTGAGQIQNLENTTTFAASKANTTTTTTVAPPPDLVASAPNLNTATPATGNEDKPIALNISAAVTDLDGSESITSITISGVPAGAVLSAGTNNGNGTWTLTPAQLTNLSITPAANSDADFTLKVSATSSEDGTTATSAQVNLAVTVNAVADTLDGEEA